MLTSSVQSEELIDNREVCSVEKGGPVQKRKQGEIIDTNNNNKKMDKKRR